MSKHITEKYQSIADSICPGRYRIPDQEPVKIVKKTETYSTTQYEIKVIDVLRGVEFTRIASDFAKRIRKDPSYVFCPTEEERVNRQKAKSLEKHGVEHPLQDPDIFADYIDKHGHLSQRDGVGDKISQKNRDNNNIAYAMRGLSLIPHGGVQAKRRATSLAKYGVEVPSQAEVIKDRIRTTNLDKYGVDNPAKAPEVRAKARATYLEKYGVESPSMLDSTKERIRLSNLEKYGVESPSMLDSTKERIRLSNLEKYGVESPSMLDSVKGKIKRSLIDVGHTLVVDQAGRTIPDIADDIGCSYTHALHTIKEHGLEEGLKILALYKDSKTKIESDVEGILKSIGVTYGYRKKFPMDTVDFASQNRLHVGGNGVVPDFIIPDHKLVIECDGLWHHSDGKYFVRDGIKIQNAVHKDYHIHKKAIYEHFGYKSLFFREDEILSNLPIVESIIRNALGICDRVYARKTKVVEIGPGFFSENHLMGAPQRKVSYGLSDGGSIVAGMAVRWISESSRILEIDRFCTKMGVSVVGGYSKLINYIERSIGPTQIVTFVDKRYGTGSFLTSLGFVLESTAPSFRWTKGSKTYNRRKFLSSSGYDHGMSKIWDCGQAKYLKII